VAKTLYERAKLKLRWWALPPVVRAVREASLSYLSEAALKDLFEQVRILESRSRKGILIEAGCALGGSAIVITAAKSKTRPLYVYDVFGMIPEPSAKDGEDVHQRYGVIKRGQSDGIGGHKYYGYEENLFNTVTENFRRHGVPVEANRVHLVKGLFQDTLRIEEPVALAHLDGDWYESVMTCLRRIEPHLVREGVLIIDDYEQWSGCREAVDEYFRDKLDHYEFVHRSRLHVVRK
jgi:Macrocin-O-methyltransferase (TylF)